MEGVAPHCHPDSLPAVKRSLHDCQETWHFDRPLVNGAMLHFGQWQADNLPVSWEGLTLCQWNDDGLASNGKPCCFQRPHRHGVGEELPTMKIVHNVAQPGLHRAILLGFILCRAPALTGRSFSCQCLASAWVLGRHRVAGPFGNRKSSLETSTGNPSAGTGILRVHRTAWAARRRHGSNRQLSWKCIPENPKERPPSGRS